MVDGERQPPAPMYRPAQSCRWSCGSHCRPKPAIIDVFISAHARKRLLVLHAGWPFLRVEAVVEDGGAAGWNAWRVATLRTVRREDLLRAADGPSLCPSTRIFRNRSLIRTMVRRDILGRYRGSFGGVFWTVLNPLLLMLTYFFVFGVVLQTRFGATPAAPALRSTSSPGMLPWLAFSEAAGRAPTVMMEHRNFVKKLVFPVETLPVNLVVSGLVTEVFALLLFAIGVFLAHGSVPVSVVWLPALLVPQVLFTAGRLLVSGRAGRFRSRPGTSDRLPADALVFPHPHLLPGSIPARRGFAVPLEESHVRAGAGLSRHLPRRPCALLGILMETVDRFGGRVHPGARLVL